MLLSDHQLAEALIARGIHTAADCAQLLRQLGLIGQTTRQRRKPTEARPGIWAHAIDRMRSPVGATHRELVGRLADAFPNRPMSELRAVLHLNLHALRLLCGGSDVMQASYAFRFCMRPSRGIVYYASGARDSGKASIRAEIARIIGRGKGASKDEMQKLLTDKFPKSDRRMLKKMASDLLCIWRSIIPDGESEAAFHVSIGTSRHEPVFRVI